MEPIDKVLNNADLQWREAFIDAMYRLQNGQITHHHLEAWAARARREHGSRDSGKVALEEFQNREAPSLL
jgi:hypothetical protein